MRADNRLRRVHAVPVAPPRGGELIGPNRTDCAEQGTECPVAVTGDELPVASSRGGEVLVPGADPGVADERGLSGNSSRSGLI